jgi:hypothetical protein
MSVRVNIQEVVERLLGNVLNSFSKEDRKLLRTSTLVQNKVAEAGRRSDDLVELKKIQNTLENVQVNLELRENDIAELVSEVETKVNTVNSFITIVSTTVDLLRTINSIIVPLASIPPLNPGLGAVVSTAQIAERQLTFTDTTVEISKNSLKNIKLVVYVLISNALQRIVGINAQLFIAIQYITELIELLEGTEFDEDERYQRQVLSKVKCLSNLCESLQVDIIPRLKASQDVIELRSLAIRAETLDLIENLQRLVTDSYNIEVTDEDSADKFEINLGSLLSRYNIKCE